MLDQNNTALVFIDVQGKLAHLMHDKDDLFRALKAMVNAANLMQLPIMWAEQLPHKLGGTVPELASLLTEHTAISKSCFSCAANDEFMAKLEQTGRRQLLVVGMEAHICVTQSVLTFLDMGYEVHLVSDAIGARNAANKDVAIGRCEKAGATISCTEMALFELMRDASHEQFKAVQALIK